MKTDKYVKLKDITNFIREECFPVDTYADKEYVIESIESEIPAADVVTRDCYDRILRENDIMRQQLADIGKGFGEKMDDVAPVVHGKWIPYKISDLFKATCPICHVDVEERYLCCPYCRTIMDL